MEEENEGELFESGGLICEIIPRKLYLGCEGGSQRKDLLEKIGIKTIVNCQIDAIKSFPDDFKYYVIPVEDVQEEALSRYFSTTYKIIETSEAPLYIHCFAGVSRSASITIAYIMKKMNMSYEDAFNYVSKRRSRIDPNPGFRIQLKNYEEELKKGGGGSSGNCNVL